MSTKTLVWGSFILCRSECASENGNSCVRDLWSRVARSIQQVASLQQRDNPPQDVVLLVDIFKKQRLQASS